MSRGANQNGAHLTSVALDAHDTLVSARVAQPVGATPLSCFNCSGTGETIRSNQCKQCCVPPPPESNKNSAAMYRMDDDGNILAVKTYVRERSPHEVACVYSGNRRCEVWPPVPTKRPLRPLRFVNRGSGEISWWKCFHRRASLGILLDYAFPVVGGARFFFFFFVADLKFVCRRCVPFWCGVGYGPLLTSSAYVPTILMTVCTKDVGLRNYVLHRRDVCAVRSRTRPAKLRDSPPVPLSTEPVMYTYI